MSAFEKVCKQKSSAKAGLKGLSQKVASQRGHKIKRRLMFRGGIDANNFDPKDISGLTLWLKADSLSQTDGSDVTEWTDQSGNGNDVSVPSDASNRPHYTTSVIGGKPAISFTGSNDEYLDCTGLSNFFKDNDYTVIAMIQPESVSSDQLIFGRYKTTDWSSSSNNNLNLFAMGINSSSKPIIIGKSPSNDKSASTSSVSTSTPYIFIARYKDSSTTQWNFINGTKKDKETDWAKGTSALAGQPVIGLQYSTGRGGTSYYNQYTGYLAELIVYNSTISEKNLKAVQNYLVDRYSLGKMTIPRI